MCMHLLPCLECTYLHVLLCIHLLACLECTVKHCGKALLNACHVRMCKWIGNMDDAILWLMHGLLDIFLNQICNLRNK